MAKSKPGKKVKSKPPKLLARPTIRSLTTAEQPVCLTTPQPSTASRYGTTCDCVSPDDRRNETRSIQYLQLDLERFVPALAEDVKLRLDSAEPLLFHEKTYRTYVLNPGALAMVKLINGSRSANKIAKRLLKEYCVAEDALLADLEAFLKSLAALGLLTTQ